MTSDKFIGYLVSVECKNVFYQGIVTNIDSNKAVIQLKNCFQNGLHCGNKLIDIKTFEIDNIEILADPNNAFNILKPKIQSATANTNSDKNEIISDINLNGSEESNKNNTSSSSTSSTSSCSIEKKSSVSGGGHYYNGKTNEKSVNVNTNNNNTKLNQNMPKRNNQSASNNNHAISNNTNNESNKSRRKDLTNGYQNHNGHSNTNLNNRNRRHNSNEAFFGSDSNDNDEFDFEQNLALFDKNAFYEEVEGHSRPSDDNEESSSAFDSVLKHISLNHTSSNHQLNEYNSKKQSSETQQTTPAVIYHPISLANLFSSSNNLTHKGNETKSGAITMSSSTTNISLSSILPSLNGGVQQQQQQQQQQQVKNGNYRFDEMILDTGEPMNMQQIKVPLNSVKKNYVTDDGFIVPCIDYNLRQMIFEQSYKQGFNKQRQIECMGRCCAEMALQLVGGPLRFSPKNNHQKPSILVLANSQHIQGVYALCTARLLSTRNVKIFLFVYNNTKVKNEQKNNSELDAFFQNELNLFQSTDVANYKLLNSTDELKNLISVDLILNGLESPDSPKFLIDNQLVRYIENCKASVVSIDPPVAGSVIQSKWCITPVLPMAMSNNCGRVYLCDLGFTKSMFQSVNIKYQSPFGAKFLIPLHND